MRRPDDVDPVAALGLPMGIGLHFDEPVAVGVAAQEIVQHTFGRRFLPLEPSEIAREIELFRHVDGPAGLRIHQPAPLAFVIAEGVVRAGHFIALMPGPAGLNASPGVNRVFALPIERAGKGAMVSWVVNGEAQLRQPRLVQHGNVAVIAVTAHDPLVHGANSRNGMTDLADGPAVHSLNDAPIVKLVVERRAQRQVQARLPAADFERAPNVLPVSAKTREPVLGDKLAVGEVIIQGKGAAWLAAEPHRGLPPGRLAWCDPEAPALVFIPKSHLARVDAIRRVGRIEQLGPRHPAVTQQRARPCRQILEVPAGKSAVLQQTIAVVTPIDPPRDSIRQSRQAPALGYLHSAAAELDAGDGHDVGLNQNLRHGEPGARGEPLTAAFKAAAHACLAADDLTPSHDDLVHDASFRVIEAQDEIAAAIRNHDAFGLGIVLD